MKVGIIGLGAIASVHIEALLALGVAIEWVCDLDGELAKSYATKLGCQWEEDYHKLLMKPSIDCVHILTPHFLHSEMAIEALRSGKHVVLEKPGSCSTEQWHDLLEEEKMAMARSGATLHIIFQNRFNPNSLFIKQWIDEQRLGKLKAIQGTVMWDRGGSYYSESPWRGRWETEGGGALINQCIHTMDLMLWFGGELDNFGGGIFNTNHPEIHVEDSAFIDMAFQSGCRGTFVGSNNHFTNEGVELRLAFERGTLIQYQESLYLEEVGKEERRVVCVNQKPNGEKGYWGSGHLDNMREMYDRMTHKELGYSTQKAQAVHQLLFNAYQRWSKDFCQTTGLDE